MLGFLTCIWAAPVSQQLLTAEQVGWQVATVAETVRDLVAPPVETVNIRAEGVLYVSRFNRCEDCDVMMFVHDGFGLQGSRHTLSPLAVWFTENFNIELYSVEYRLFSQGSGLDEAAADVREAVTWLRAQRPSAKLIVMGASAGGSLLVHVLRGDRPLGADLAVVDSSLLCFTELAEQLEDNEYTRPKADELRQIGLLKQTFYPEPYFRGDDCAQPLVVPTVVLHSAVDPVVPVEQVTTYGTVPNATTCISQSGFHLLAFSGPCADLLFDSLAALDVPRRYMQPYGGVSTDVLGAVVDAFSAFDRVLPGVTLQTLAICLLMSDPTLRRLYKCE